MKNFGMCLFTAIITAVIVVSIMVCKFGAFDVSNHTDHYVTLRNGEVISTYDKTELDEINYDVTVNHRINIFSR